MIKAPTSITERIATVVVKAGTAESEGVSVPVVVVDDAVVVAVVLSGSVALRIEAKEKQGPPYPLEIKSAPIILQLIEQSMLPVSGFVVVFTSHA
jgi:hypothetical protein